MNDYDVAAGAGTLRSASADAVHFPHGWTPGGVTVESAFTGAHLLHLAVEADAVAEIPETVRAGASVARVPLPDPVGEPTV